MNINYKSNQENQMHTSNDAYTVACCTPSDHCATVTTQAESITEQIDVCPAVIAAGPVVVKILVVLAETNITIPVEATITLDQVAIEIKRIKKNVFLTQSRLIPFYQDSYPTPGKNALPLQSGKLLFIAGFVRKNIEYSTQTCPVGTSVNVCGHIRHCIVEVPFKFTTRIDFIKLPVFEENTTPSELEFFIDKTQGCDVCSDPVLGRNSCDQSFFSTEFFNEKPYVELVKADITEIDIHTNPTSNCQTPTEQMFTQLTEKIVINLTQTSKMYPL